jgi:hypothetical protein
MDDNITVRKLSVSSVKKIITTIVEIVKTLYKEMNKDALNKDKIICEKSI